MKAIAQRFLTSKLNLFPRDRKLNNSFPTGALPCEIAQLISSGAIRFLQLSTIYCLLFSLYSPSTHPKRPIIFKPLMNQNQGFSNKKQAITIDKSITYVTIRPFTLVKNIRQIGPFMQNKPKVKIGKINLIYCKKIAYEK
jgi:hypothetical protein